MERSHIITSKELNQYYWCGQQTYPVLEFLRTVRK
jgi:hypothetical protein